jgi:hypothetical protein
MIIHSKKHLFSVLPNNKYKNKIIGKAFTKGKNNPDVEVQLIGSTMIWTHETELVKCMYSCNIQTLTLKNIKDINLSKVLFKQSNFSVDFSRSCTKNYYFLTSDYQYLSFTTNSFNTSLSQNIIHFCKTNNRSDIIDYSSKQSHILKGLILNSPNHFRKIGVDEHPDIKPWSLVYLCKIEKFPIKKGCLINVNNDYTYITKPISFLNYSPSRFNNRTIFDGVNFNLESTTLDEISNVKKENTKMELNREFLIKLWKEIFNN